MLRGQKTYLRARIPADVPVLQEHLYEDVPTRVRADTRPWRPLARDSSDSPYAPAGPQRRRRRVQRRPHRQRRPRR